LGSLHCAAYNAARQAAAGEVKWAAGKSAGSGGKERAVDMASTVYMLNPGGDLPATQAAFETLFTGQPQWQVGSFESSNLFPILLVLKYFRNPIVSLSPDPSGGACPFIKSIKKLII
jgi:hypothetical protein